MTHFLRKLFLPFSVVVILLYCILLIFSSLHPELPEEGEEPRLYSNQIRQDLRYLYISAIQQAQKSIHLVMFGLNDAAILKALAERTSHQIPATIYYDASESPQINKKLHQADLHPVRLSGLMHQKILILDQNLVFIGSANMTSSSLLMHDNLVVGLRSNQVADFLTHHAPQSSGYLHTMVGGQDIELWLLPDLRGNALASLRHEIQKARSSIKIAIFTLTHPLLCEELIAALHRKVNVTIVVDMHSGYGASTKAIEQLRQNGVKILFSQGVQLLHHKFAWIDDQTLLSGSANWTKAAFTKNSDCILTLHNMTDEQQKFMQELWKRIETEAFEASQTF